MIIDHPKNDALPALRALWREAFGDTDAFISAFFDTAFHRDRCLCLYDGDDLASALYWLDCTVGDERLAYLYAIATAERHRGRGLCHRLMDETHRRLADLGYTGAVLVPGSETLFRFYGRMGYRICGHVHPIHCVAKPAPLTLRRIGREEYALRRAALLPKDGVVQENESLAFLASYATLYTGEGVLLAAYADEETLCGIELLGDPTLAPAITSALGFAQGTFRTPGGNTPFAMHLPLTDGARTPTYFGLAFD
ncbi:MAG: GNAT family N-acetyltransferase [Clostridia bacterium]|nr:GNAT family N-acetyltransferase [Clostridia bacterium]